MSEQTSRWGKYLKVILIFLGYTLPICIGFFVGRALELEIGLNEYAPWFAYFVRVGLYGIPTFVSLAFVDLVTIQKLNLIRSTFYPWWVKFIRNALACSGYVAAILVGIRIAAKIDFGLEVRELGTNSSLSEIFYEWVKSLINLLFPFFPGLILVIIVDMLAVRRVCPSCGRNKALVIDSPKVLEYGDWYESGLRSSTVNGKTLYRKQYTRENRIRVYVHCSECDYSVYRYGTQRETRNETLD